MEGRLVACGNERVVHSLTGQFLCSHSCCAWLAFTATTNGANRVTEPVAVQREGGEAGVGGEQPPDHERVRGAVRLAREVEVCNGM